MSDFYDFDFQILTPGDPDAEPKYIFLDVDGVLNCGSTGASNPYGNAGIEKKKLDLYSCFFACPICISYTARTPQPSRAIHLFPAIVHRFASPAATTLSQPSRSYIPTNRWHF